MHRYIFALGSVLCLFLLLVQATQSNPPQAIDPPYNAFEALQEHDLFHDLPSHQKFPPDIRVWPQGIVPDVCHHFLKDGRITPNATNMEVRDVYYTDCDAPWTICRYKDSLISWNKAMVILGKIPVGMRQHVAHVILAPESYAKKNRGIVAATMEASTAFLSAMDIGVAVHEFNHILDAVIGSHQPQSKLISESPEWNWYYQRDSKVPTSYAASSLSHKGSKLVEEFADSGRWAMSNMARARSLSRNKSSSTISRDGNGSGSEGSPFFLQNRTMAANQLAVYSANWTECRNQIGGYRLLLEGRIFPPGGRCTGKTPTSDAVNATTGERVHSMVGAGKHKLRSVGVPEIIPADWAMNIRFPPYNASI
ncbi:conidiation-specific protein (con-13) protein [Apiospora arundinis]|uniref:Conidiation-specific protein (Con-13) protein n=1 Tax=Apiospora arundinis TaxID=335852 RepID=A0ABR2IF34_9PEZI